MVIYDPIKDLQALSICAFVLFLKMLAVGFYTGYHRSKEGRPAAPEDRKADAGASQPLTGKSDSESNVDRGLNMHRNDLENIPIFLILAILLVQTSGLNPTKASYIAHIVYYAVFTAARIGHTILYMLGIPKIRGVCWGIGVLTTIAMCIHMMVQLHVPKH